MANINDARMGARMTASAHVRTRTWQNTGAARKQHGLYARNCFKGRFFAPTGCLNVLREAGMLNMRMYRF
jgi:hypothetical protein